MMVFFNDVVLVDDHFIDMSFSLNGRLEPFKTRFECRFGVFPKRLYSWAVLVAKHSGRLR